MDSALCVTSPTETISIFLKLYLSRINYSMITKMCMLILFYINAVSSSVLGICKTLHWWTSKRVLCCFQRDSQQFNLRTPSSVLFNPAQSQHHTTSELVQCIKAFPPALPSSFYKNFRTCSRQFVRSFCSKSSGIDLQNEASTSQKNDSTSKITGVAPKLSHVDKQGHAQMVDVGSKTESSRLSVATAKVYLGQTAFNLVKENKIHKGDVLTVAQLAGIMASKQTPNLIPLCHNIHITHAEVNLELDEKKLAVCITGSVNSVGRTGVEMESLTAVTVAALTVYDMCKAVSREIAISDIKLVKKVGGKSGDYVAT